METEEKKSIEPQPAWSVTEHKPGPWVRAGVRYGTTVKPPNEQTSNEHLRNDQVLQPRVEPIGQNSLAKPIMPGEDRSVDFTPSQPM